MSKKNKQKNTEKKAPRRENKKSQREIEAARIKAGQAPNAPQRKQAKQKRKFVPTDKLRQIWDKLRGYGWTIDEENPSHRISSVKKANQTLQGVEQRFGLSNLNQTKKALLQVPNQFNGRLKEDLAPVYLKQEIMRVQLIRTLLLTNAKTYEDRADLQLDLVKLDTNELRKMRGVERDRIWNEDREAQRQRIKKIKDRAKKKGKLKTEKKPKKQTQSA